MATIFESRPRASSPTPKPALPVEECPATSSAVAALDAAARELLEITISNPIERRRAAELLAFHARKLGRLAAVHEDEA